MVSISIPSEVIHTWVEQNPRYVALIKSDTFQHEVQSAYEYLLEKSEGRVQIKSRKQFAELAERKVAVEFAQEVAEAYFSGKNEDTVEKETISNSQWVSEQIRFAREISWHTIQANIWEANRQASREWRAFELEEGEGY